MIRQISDHENEVQLPGLMQLKDTGFGAGPGVSKSESTHLRDWLKMSGSSSTPNRAVRVVWAIQSTESNTGPFERFPQRSFCSHEV